MKSAFILVLAAGVAGVSPLHAADINALTEQGQACYKRSDYPCALENWRAALSAAQDAGDSAAAARLMGKIGKAYRFAGELDKALDYSERALAASRAGNDSMGIGDNLSTIGLVHFKRKDYDKARDFLQRALEMHRAAGDKKGESIDVSNLGDLYSALGDNDKYFEYQWMSVALDKKAGNKAFVAIDLLNIGSKYHEVKQNEKALDAYVQSLSISREMGDRRMEANNLVNMGIVYASMRDFSKALENFSGSLDIRKKSGDRKEIAEVYNHMGNCFLDLYEREKALEYYNLSLEINRSLNLQATLSMNLVNIGAAYHAYGEQSRALDYFRQALEIREKLADLLGKARILSNMCVVYMEMGDYARAEECVVEALRIRRALPGKDELSVSLNGMGRLAYVRGAYKAALKYYDDALKAAEAEKNSIQTAVVLNEMGEVFRGMADYGKAFEYYQKAVDLDYSIKDTASAMAGLGNMGMAYYEMGNYQKALELIENARAFYRDSGNRIREATAVGNIGMIYAAWANYDKALDFYGQALEMNRAVGNRSAEASILNNLGLARYELGDYPKALEAFRAASDITASTGERVLGATLAANIGSVYRDMGDFEKDMEYNDRAWAIATEVGSRKIQALSLGNKGVLRMEMGDFSGAVESTREALSIAQEIGDGPSEAIFLNNIGTCYIYVGNPDEAEKYFQQALSSGKAGKITATIEGNIADIYIQKGELDKAWVIASRNKDPLRLSRYYMARKNYSEVKNILEKRLASLEASRQTFALPVAYTLLGQAEEGLSDFKAAAGWYLKAVSLLEDQREGLAPSRKAGFLSGKMQMLSKIEPYEGLVRANFAGGKGKTAFYYAEFTRGRRLAESIAGRHAGQASLPESVAKDEERINGGLAAAVRQAQAAFEKNNAEVRREMEAEAGRLRKERSEFVEKLRSRYPEYAAVNYPEPVASDAVPLESDEVLAEFDVTESETVLFLLSGGKKALRTVKIPLSRKELSGLVAKYRTAFENVERASDLIRYDAYAGKKLFDALFGDTLSSLPSGTKLVIVPDEILGVLPFESLPMSVPSREQAGSGAHGPFPLGMTYLGDKFAVSYAQSATSLTLLRTLDRKKAATAGALVLVDPVFSNDDRRAAGGVPGKTASLSLMGAVGRWKNMGAGGTRGRGETASVQSGDSESLPLFPRLEKTARVADELKRLFPGTVVLSGMKASKAELMRLPLDKYRYMAFGTHGILDGTVPYIRQPALVLTQAGVANFQDGFLPMSEVMGMKINADVAALTACETGLGASLTGEGVMGMGRAFQYAGASNVLISLWSVSEDASVALTDAFFSRLEEGKTPSEALSLARESIRRAGYEHPFYWSAFILMGR